VRGISFTVPKGEIFALLGTNGAGKTTTMEVLEGFTPATDGTVRNYLSSAITKLGATNRINAIREAQEKGWL
jgi:ABC-type multidrug transport system ATPase subunit